MNIGNTSVCWIPQQEYLKMYGEDVKSIDRRIHKKIWTEGKHFSVPKGSKTRWINLVEVDKWAAGE